MNSVINAEPVSKPQAGIVLLAVRLLTLAVVQQPKNNPNKPVALHGLIPLGPVLVVGCLIPDLLQVAVGVSCSFLAEVG